MHRLPENFPIKKHLDSDFNVDRKKNLAIGLRKTIEVPRLLEDFDDN